MFAVFKVRWYCCGPRISPGVAWQGLVAQALAGVGKKRLGSFCERFSPLLTCGAEAGNLGRRAAGKVGQLCVTGVPYPARRAAGGRRASRMVSWKPEGGSRRPWLPYCLPFKVCFCKGKTTVLVWNIKQNNFYFSLNTSGSPTASRINKWA